MEQILSQASFLVNGKGADMLLAVINLFLLIERSKFMKGNDKLINTLFEKLNESEKEKEQLHVKYQAILMRMEDKHNPPLA